MFSFLTKKLPPVTEPEHLSEQYIPASKRTDDELIGMLNDVFSKNRPVVGALLLVAIEEFPARYCIFKRSTRRSNRYFPSMDGMIRFSFEMHTQYQGDDLESEIASTQWYFIYVAGLLTLAQERAEKTPALWQPIAKIWVKLMDAAKNLRSALSSTCIWNIDEVFFFDIIKEDDEGIITFVENALLPSKLRFHPLLLGWKQRNLQLYPTACFISEASGLGLLRYS